MAIGLLDGGDELITSEQEAISPAAEAYVGSYNPLLLDVGRRQGLGRRGAVRSRGILQGLNFVLQCLSFPYKAGMLVLRVDFDLIGFRLDSIGIFFGGVHKPSRLSIRFIDFGGRLTVRIAERLGRDTVDRLGVGLDLGGVQVGITRRLAEGELAESLLVSGRLLAQSLHALKERRAALHDSREICADMRTASEP